MAARILVIDDDPAVRRQVSTLLEPLGFAVEAAESGPEGLQRGVARPPDLVLLDAEMPGMDGYEICRALCRGAALETLPVIMLTASTESALTGKAYQAGASACLCRPLRRESLVALVAALLASRPTGPPDETK
jgi:two-component system chemotaxis response regulator CheY